MDTRNAKELHHVAYMVEKDIAVPKERLHRKKSETVETDLVAAAEPMRSGTLAKTSMMIIFILFSNISKRADIDIKIICMLYSKKMSGILVLSVC